LAPQADLRIVRQCLQIRRSPFQKELVNARIVDAMIPVSQTELAGQWCQMRKRIVNTHSAGVTAESRTSWLDLTQIATVEVSSEDPRFPIESAFTEGTQGWRAGEPGLQQIRLIFDQPVSVRRIQLRFHDSTTERTQEFILRWSAAHGGESREIIRQQWNFSPAGSATEVEDYAVDLDNLSVLELAIRPDISRHEAKASLAAFLVR
jgi:hypothetical protein